jgi:probable rRNA maturation factor
VSLTIDIARESPLWDAEPAAEAVIERAVAAALAVGRLDHAPAAELSVVLTDDAGIATLNGQWRRKDRPTNVLSFPAAPPHAIVAAPLIGDIVLAYETIAREAAADAMAFDDHLAHLAVHGLLHLFGYDHLDDDEAEKMERLETRILADLGVADPYADRPLSIAS